MVKTQLKIGSEYKILQRQEPVLMVQIQAALLVQQF